METDLYAVMHPRPLKNFWLRYWGLKKRLDEGRERGEGVRSAGALKGQGLCCFLYVGASTGFALNKIEL